MSHQSLISIANGITSINDYIGAESVFEDILTSMRIIYKYRPQGNGDTSDVAISWDSYVQIQQDIIGLAALNSKIGMMVGILKSAFASTESFIKYRRAEESCNIRRAYETGSRDGRATDKAVDNEVIVMLRAEEEELFDNMAKYESIINAYRSINDMINALKLQLRVLEDEKKIGV